MSSTGPKTQLPRYHSIDSLRAVTMLLVLVFHAAIVYLPFDTDRVLYQDAMRSPFTGWVVLFTRLFHMPVFFLVSGFFAAFLFDTRGTQAFLRHRLKRIGLPLVCSFLVLYPLMAAGDLYTKFLTGDAPLNVGRELQSFVQTVGIDLWHLWFLYQLLILCVAGRGHYAINPLCARGDTRPPARPLQGHGLSLVGRCAVGRHRLFDPVLSKRNFSF